MRDEMPGKIHRPDATDLDAILDRAGESNVLEDIHTLVAEVRRLRETARRAEHMENVIARIPAHVLRRATREAEGAETPEAEDAWDVQWCVQLADDPFSEAINCRQGPEGERRARQWHANSKPGAIVYRRTLGPWQRVEYTDTCLTCGRRIDQHTDREIQTSTCDALKTHGEG